MAKVPVGLQSLEGSPQVWRLPVRRAPDRGSGRVDGPRPGAAVRLDHPGRRCGPHPLPSAQRLPAIPYRRRIPGQDASRRCRSLAADDRVPEERPEPVGEARSLNVESTFGRVVARSLRGRVTGSLLGQATGSRRSVRTLAGIRGADERAGRARG